MVKTTDTGSMICLVHVGNGASGQIERAASILSHMELVPCRKVLIFARNLLQPIFCKPASLKQLQR